MITKYIALLRGINVGGNKKVPMAELKKMFEDLGFENVTTYINSGNVIFDSKIKNATKVCKQIEAEFEKKFFQTFIVIRTADEIARTLEDNPFKNVKLDKDTVLYVSFMYSLPSKEQTEMIESMSDKVERYRIQAGEFYALINKKGMHDSVFAKDIVGKKFKIPNTVRNWNTVNKLLELSR